MGIHVNSPGARTLRPVAEDWIVAARFYHISGGRGPERSLAATSSTPTTLRPRSKRSGAGASKRLPRREMVFAYGNHDSAVRLEAPHPLFEAFGIQVVGSMPRDGRGRLDYERGLLPSHGPDGDVAARCVGHALPAPGGSPPVGERQ